MDSPVDDEMAGCGNALLFGVIAFAAGFGVLCWVVSLCAKSAYRAIRRRILSAKSKRDTGSP